MAEVFGIIYTVIRVIGLVIICDALLLLLVWRIRMLNRNIDRREKEIVRRKKEKKAQLIEEVEKLYDPS